MRQRPPWKTASTGPRWHWCAIPEVCWLHPQVVRTGESEWRYRKDNPTMPQIFTGTVPLMGSVNEIWKQWWSHFSLRKEISKGAGEDLQQHGVQMYLEYYLISDQKLLYSLFISWSHPTVTPVCSSIFRNPIFPNYLWLPHLVFKLNIELLSNIV